MAAPPPRPPNDFRDAVVALPDDFFPYGADCPFGRDVQAVFHHHGVIQYEADTLRHLGFHSIASFALVNPDGDGEAKRCCKETLVSFESPLCRRRLTLVFRRILAEDMFAALPRAAPALVQGPPVAPTPPPVAAADADPVPPVDAAGAAAAPAVANAAPAAADGVVALRPKGTAKRRRSSSSSSSDSSGSGVESNEDPGDKSGGKKAKDSKEKGSTKDAAAMMESLNSEVRLLPCFLFPLLLLSYL